MMTSASNSDLHQARLVYRGYWYQDLSSPPSHGDSRLRGRVSLGHCDSCFSRVLKIVQFRLGVIIGKAGFNISKDSAWSHVWGACIVNDVG